MVRRIRGILERSAAKRADGRIYAGKLIEAGGAPESLCPDVDFLASGTNSWETEVDQRRADRLQDLRYCGKEVQQGASFKLMVQGRIPPRGRFVTRVI